MNIFSDSDYWELQSILQERRIKKSKRFYRGEKFRKAIRRIKEILNSLKIS